MKIIIIGGVAGGASAAARLRRLDEHAEIIMFERGKHISFANCGIPYFCGDVIKDEEKLLLMNPEKFKQMLNVEARVEAEVLSIDRARKVVRVRNLITGQEYEENYDKLVLSPGAAPIKPNIEGIENEKIFTIRSVEDGKKVKSFAKPGMKAAVVGGGFIGLEMAENLMHAGVMVSVVEMSTQVLGPIDIEMAAQVHNHLRSKNVELILSDGVRSFESIAGNGNSEENNEADRVRVSLQSGRNLDVDFVIFAIGVAPETKLARESGLETGVTKGILVDEYLRTSDENIYALGDAVEVCDPVSNGEALIPLAGPANKQGRIVAENIMGMNSVYKGTLGTAIVKVFDLTVASCGNNEKQLQRKNIKYQKAYSVDWSHATYYGNPFQLSLKLLFSPDNGRILGAQIIGIEGVDKRIDSIAAAMAFSGTAADLARLELAYAPPYSSAKDPVNVIGMIAENIRSGRMPIVHWENIDTEDKDNFLLDIRSVQERSLIELKNSVHIPYEELRARIDEVPKDKMIIIICNQGKKAYFAAQILLQNEYNNVQAVSGGMFLYRHLMNDEKGRRSGNSESGKAVEKIIAGKGESVMQKKTLVIELDACGLQCPGPIMKLSQKIQEVKDKDIVEVRTTDPGFKADVVAWCKSTNNTMMGIKEEKGLITASIMKGTLQQTGIEANGQCGKEKDDGKTIVVFSNDLDKALASFVIANGAAATGKKVTMFFTFWGLSVLRKENAPSVHKTLLEKMLGWMLPKGVGKLALSKMHMLGMGTLMMKYVMKQKNVSALHELIMQAKEQGIRMIACQMSLDVMGLKKEELIDGVEFGGVASYIESAEHSDINLFI